MNTYTCIGKIRDENNIIKQYVLKEHPTNREIRVNKDELKSKIINKQVVVDNLKIDTQGRLIDSVPKQPQQSHQHSTSPQDMSNRELLQFIKDLDNNTKTDNNKLFAVLKEFYRRYISTDDKVNQILRQLNEDENGIDESTISNQMNAIQSYLLENADNLEQIKSNLDNLNTKLQNLQNSSGSQERQIFSPDGNFEMPSDTYSKYFYERYFTPVDNNKLSINDQAILSLLKEEMEKAYKAYIDTETFYNAQLSDYADSYKDSQLLGLITGVVSERLGGMNPNTCIEIAKEAGINFAENFLPIENFARLEKTKMRFSNDPKLSKEKAKSIMNNVGGIWNTAIDFIANNESWEIMLYVIQTLNNTYFGTYKVADKRSHYMVESEKGEMKVYNDSTFFDKNAKALTEKPLEGYYKIICDFEKLKDKVCECEKQLYDRFIVSYFAAKKVMYKYDLYPFSTSSSPRINGVLVKLIENGLVLSNVQEHCIENMIGEFCCYNKKAKKHKYEIDTNVNLSDYLTSTPTNQ